MRAVHRTALPLLYSASLSALWAVHVLSLRGSRLALPLWVAVVVVESMVRLGLEQFGGRLVSAQLPRESAAFLDEHTRTVSSYSIARRAYYLGLAGVCWFVCGIGTVVLFAWLGASLRARVDVLARVAVAVAELPASVRTLVCFLGLDLWSYFRHRIEHMRGERGVLYRWVHRFHHLPEEMNMYTGSQVHPIESVLVFAVPCFALGALGWERWELLFLLTLFLVITMPQHLNSGFSAGPFAVLFHGPEAHTRHHSVDYEQRNANYADCLTLWDRLFGTYVAPGPAPFPGPFGPGVERSSG